MNQISRIFIVAGVCLPLWNCSTKTGNVQEKSLAMVPKEDSTPQAAVLQSADIRVTTHSDSSSSQASDTVSVITGNDIFLLEPTYYHGDEVEKHWEEKQWYGLFQVSDNEFEIRATRISIASVHDVVVDDEGESTGWHIQVQDKDTLPVVLIGGNITLKERRFSGKRQEYKVIQPGSSIFLNKEYQVQAFGNSRIYDKVIAETQLYNYGLEMVGPHKRQRLFSHYDFIREGPYIYWQGYLDEDNIPDLLIDCSKHYNAQRLVLFLSSSLG